jgi:hypothetical protein
METGLKARQVAALEEALRTTNAFEADESLRELRALGFATRSEEIPEPARPGRPITDFFGVQKGALRTVALLPHELWPEYRYEATIGNAVWLCYCDACDRLATMPSYKLRPRSLTHSCGCSRRRKPRSPTLAQA